MKRLFTSLIIFPTLLLTAQDDCIDPSLIDPDAICFDIFQPVCGCDGMTYSNECYAVNFGGVTSWTDGECPTVSPGDCPELNPELDFGMCAAVIGVALINNECIAISGCGTIASDGVNYSEFFYDDLADCQACLQSDCINPDQIDPEAVCIEIYDPVCGCDDVTYDNECYAFFYGGVTSWTEGECPGEPAEPAEPCTDLEGLDFGLCDMFLGHAVVSGMCQPVSGCGWELDNVDYSAAFYDTTEECEACLVVDCINPDQIDPDMMCLDIWDPVCGCDGETYSNDCYAFYFGGVTSWTPGECLPTSIEEVNKNQILVEPRPNFSLRLYNQQLIERFDVFDLTGKHILSRESLAPGEYFFQLPVSYAGMYIVRAQSQNEVISQKVLLH